MLKAVRRLFVVAGMLVATAPLAVAQGTWVEISSPHFSVVSNAGDGRAREIAWQFEQVRSAIVAGWPWARTELDRPVLVIAAKDESTCEPTNVSTPIRSTGPIGCTAR